jgi:hypothetical protein
MYLMYVDGSGDSGLQNSPTRYYILTGLVIHELRWQQYLDQIVDFRRRMRSHFGLRLAEEIHAAAMVSRPGPLIRIARNDRLTILRAFADELAALPDINIINIVVDKQGKAPPYDAFEMAWKALLQRFENTIIHRNFPGPANPDEKGAVFPDNTDNRRVTQLLRQVRRYNPVPNQQRFGIGYRNLLVRNLIEDPSFRDSRHSYFIQAADLCAYLLLQYLSPCAYFRKKGARTYFRRLDPILCKVASTADPLGIVRL